MVANSEINHTAMKLRKPRSFIMETLVVVSVLGIVAAFVVPVSVDDRPGDAKPIGTVKTKVGDPSPTKNSETGAVPDKSPDKALVSRQARLNAGKPAGTADAGSLDSF